MKRCGLLTFILMMAATWVRAGDDSVKQSLAYVQKLQTDSGGFRAQLPKGQKIPPTLRATSAAIRAFKYLGGELKNKEGTMRFVESCWDAEAGGFADTPGGKPDVFTTSVGLMAVVQLKMPVDMYADAAGKFLGTNAKSFEEIRIAAAGFENIQRRAPKAGSWIKVVLQDQNEDGTFGAGAGQARESASRVVTMLRLTDKVPAAGTLIPKVLDSGQRKNGGWGKADDADASDLETTYRVLRCYYMLKARPGNVEGVRSFVAKCKNADGGYGIAPGQPSSVGGTYFAAIVLYWLKE